MIDNLTDEQIEEVLKRNVLGRIGFNDGIKTYVVPINYVFDGKFIIAHSFIGKKIQVMRENPAVCFEVDEMIGFTKWKSVIAWGEYQEMADERERYFAMKMFVDKMMHVKMTRPAGFPETAQEKALTGGSVNLRPVIYRIVITEKTGRFENSRG